MVANLAKTRDANHASSLPLRSHGCPPKDPKIAGI
jgi:hypothetical protein